MARSLSRVLLAIQAVWLLFEDFIAFVFAFFLFGDAPDHGQFGVFVISRLVLAGASFALVRALRQPATTSVVLAGFGVECLYLAVALAPLTPERTGLELVSAVMIAALMATLGLSLGNENA